MRDPRLYKDDLEYAKSRHGVPETAASEKADKERLEPELIKLGLLKTRDKNGKLVTIKPKPEVKPEPKLEPKVEVKKEPSVVKTKIEPKVGEKKVLKCDICGFTCNSKGIMAMHKARMHKKGK